jgi:uncharacterized zinc-type alcohol dehydrogenase-like protein
MSYDHVREVDFLATTFTNEYSEDHITMPTVHAYAATEAKGVLKPFEYELPEQLAHDEVEITIKHCGICHSDLSVLNDAWGMSQYPLIPGHEVVGTVKAIGEHVTHLEVGQDVGAGWYARSCITCDQCMSGNHNLCASAEGIMMGRPGGFADRVRVQSHWVTPLPEGILFADAGPLFCGGITVFNPIVENSIRPTSRVGVVGIGGLGHMALRFLHAWGCEVTAFSTTPDKEAEAKSLGAHHFVATRDDAALENLAGAFDMILVTVNADLNWDLYVNALAPKGKLHLVGAASQVTASVFPMIVGQRSIGASPLGSPATTREMIRFAAQHGITPQTEHFSLAQVNEAMAHLQAGKARYRVVLDMI